MSNIARMRETILRKKSIMLRRVQDCLGSAKSRYFQNSSQIIRKVEVNDLDKVLEIFHDSFGDRAPIQVINYFKKFKNTFYVREINDNIVGYIGFYVHPRFEISEMKIVLIATIYSVAVKGGMRNKGVATLMYGEGLRQMRLNGVKLVRAYYNVNNEASKRLHQKLGFTVIDTIDNMYESDAGNLVELKL